MTRIRMLVAVALTTAICGCSCRGNQSCRPGALSPATTSIVEPSRRDAGDRTSEQRTDEELLAALEGTDREAVTKAAIELAARSDRTLPALLQRLESNAAAWGARESLVSTSDRRRTSEALIPVLASSNRLAVVNAAMVLRQMGPDGILAAPALIWVVRRGGANPFQSSPPQGDWSAQAALESMGEEVVPLVGELLDDPDESVRTAGIRILGGIGRPALSESIRLARSLSSASYFERRWVLHNLERIGAVTDNLRQVAARLAVSDPIENLREMAKTVESLPVVP